MRLHERIRRLEGANSAAAAGPGRCKLCRDGTQATALVVTLPGEGEPNLNRPCPGCGRNNPVWINIIPAEVPEGAPCG